MHPGVSSLFVIIRQNYWTIGARNLRRELTYKWIICFRQAPHTTQQRMADPPTVRVRQIFPFQNSGCDYADPFTLKFYHGRNPNTSKGYICIFVCMGTSAIHFELETDLTTDCFLAPLKRFIARRGKCSTIYSNNGKNFIVVRRKLNEMHQQLFSEQYNRSVTEALAKEDKKWIFIIPYAPLGWYMGDRRVLSKTASTTYDYTTYTNRSCH